MYPETLQLLCWCREAKCLGKKLREYRPRTAEQRILAAVEAVTTFAISFNKPFSHELGAWTGSIV
jgi:hypothetical protein